MRTTRKSKKAAKKLTKEQKLKIKMKAAKTFFKEKIQALEAESREKAQLFNELKEQHNQLASASDTLLKKDLQIETENKALKEQVSTLSKTNEEAHATITRQAEEKQELERKYKAVEQTMNKYVTEKATELVTTIPESEVTETTADAGSSSGAV